MSADGAWSNQLVDLIILAASNAGFSGFFAYNPAPGPGNLEISIAGAAGTDPYGNHYPRGFASFSASGVTVIDGAAVLTYSGSIGFGNLIQSTAPAGFTDPSGNAVLRGTTTYLAGSPFFATSINGGFIDFYTAPGAAGPWTLQGTIEISSAGPTLLLNFPVLAGGINVPQPPIAVSMPISLPPPATYSQVYLGVAVAAINQIYDMLTAANVHT